jgi:S-formylglutathione hydrolase
METAARHLAHGGTQGIYTHRSKVTDCNMTFAVYTPPAAADGPCPVLWYLSGLTCTHANVMEKGEYRRAAAEAGLVIACPDSSPRGGDVPDSPDYDLGQGAGFYLDATEPPWAQHFQMYTYLTRELPDLVAASFPVDMARQGIFGHSMGGHGALTMALKNPGRYRSVSAFAPICHPLEVDWGRKAFPAYLGDDQASWRAHDAVCLIEDGARLVEILVDQGTADGFLDSQLRPRTLQEACQAAGIALTLNMREGYDHSYFFISSFMAGHVMWHAERLARPAPSPGSH